jgi:predicted O-methyltransferase YrrM
LDVQKMKLSSFVKRLPGYQRINSVLSRHYDRYAKNPFIRFAAPGHFYSPIPDLGFVIGHKDKLFNRGAAEVPGIEINAGEQVRLIEELSRYYGELPFTPQRTAAHRYYFDNDYFSYGDAIILYSMLRQYRPRQIIEVGSGFSSAVMLDTETLFLGGATELTFIEPYPERLYSLLTEQDRQKHEVIEAIVQDVPAARFSGLAAGDILFIDSSHVAKVGSDVVYLLSEVLPRLSPGVLVHFHDVFWPFEYPEEWIREGRAWNENYVLKAFLQFNTSFKIMCFNSYLGIHHEAVMEQRLPLFMKNTGGSLWLEKTA